MNSNDFVKYITVQLVEKMDKPKSKSVKKHYYSSHWFGVIPLSLKMMARKLQKNK